MRRSERQAWTEDRDAGVQNQPPWRLSRQPGPSDTLEHALVSLVVFCSCEKRADRSGVTVTWGGDDLMVAQPSEQPAAVAASPRSAATPRWVEIPSPEQVLKAYPTVAFRSHQAGYAVMQCRLKATGRLGDCVITREEPAAAGFGEATLGLAWSFRAQVKAPGGASLVGEPIVLPIRWVPPPEGDFSSR